MKIIPSIKSIIQQALNLVTFQSSEKYWNDRYKQGGNSGNGSYGQLAEYKSKIINDFIRANGINTIIEYGCGDGNQLKLAKYPHYIGFDVSPHAISICKKIFNTDETKFFYLVNEYKNQKADIALSLDVIYHLVEDDVFEKHIRQLFSSSERFVIIYSTNFDGGFLKGLHIKHRHFTGWIKTNLPSWKMVSHITNKYSVGYHAKDSSKADFFIYQKIQD